MGRSAEPAGAEPGCGGSVPARGRRVGGAGAAVVGACAALALAVVLAPWYALAAYTATGWEGTGWARVALVLALASGGLTLADDRLLAVVASVLALAAVAYRVAVPPDFGFGFGGLDVPVERRLGCWIAVAAAVAAAGLAAWRARGGA